MSQPTPERHSSEKLVFACGCVGYVSALPTERPVEAVPIAEGLTSESLRPPQLVTHRGPPLERRSEDGDDVWTQVTGRYRDR